MSKTTQLSGLLLVLAFVTPSSAVAGPIDIGSALVTSSVTAGAIQDQLADPLQTELSLDCPDCGAGSIVRWNDNPQIVYMNTGTQGWKLYRVNAVGGLFDASGWVGYTFQDIRTIGLTTPQFSSSSGNLVGLDDHGNTSPVPEPSTLILLGSSVGLLGVRKKVLALRTVRR